MKTLDHYWNSINFVSLILLPLSGLFCLLSWLRVRFYRLGILKSYKAPLPVIIVGNISVGGTGKTPLIIELIKQLRLQGKKPGVISRGYGGHGDSWPQIVSAETTPQQVGDEPQLIYQRTQCPLVVGPNRKQDIELLTRQFDCDIVLSDDGLQHYALQRDIEIVVVDAVKQFGNGLCLPAGPLRETESRLQQADLILLNGGDETQDAFIMRPSLCKSVGQKPETEVNIDDFSGKRVHAIAGIGHPQRFFKMLEANNISVIPHVFADHYRYKESDFLFGDDIAVLMTEKDAVKCSQFNLKNHWSVPVEISLTASAQQKLDKIFGSL